MRNSNSILTLVETAEAATPTCQCGAPMIPADRDGGLWLVCSNQPAPGRGLRSRLLSLDWVTPHDRVFLLDADELAAA